MENKFKTNLTLANRELKAKRADLIVEDVKIAAEGHIRDLKDKKRQLDRDLMDLEDFGPENNTTLRPVSKDFDAKSWFTKVVELKMEISLLDVDIDIAEETYNDYFAVELPAEEA